MTDKLDPQPCSVPNCKTESLWTSVGPVGGRYESQCVTHALRHATREHKAAADRLAALRAVEVPGQMDLLA